MLNEIMTIYSYVFEFLEQKILDVEKGIDISELADTEKQRLLSVIKPILEKRKIDLQQMKERILQSKITL